MIISIIGFKAGTTRHPVTIRPDIRSCIYAAALYFAMLFKLKGIKDTFKSWIDIAQAILVIIVIASLIRIMFSNVSVPVPFFKIKIDITTLMVCLVVIAWISNGLTNLVVLGLLIVLMRYSAGNAGEILSGFKGWLFIGCTVIGIITYVSQLPGFYQLISSVKLKAQTLLKKT